MMANWSNMLALAAVAVVAATLLLGLVNLLRGGSGETSQKLMRWRIGLQLCAFLTLLTILALRR